MKIAIIPARGGSKRIPRKNIKLFHGKPIIAWSIETAIASGCFDQVIVSTDDEEIAEVSRAWGATVPFIRPAELSNDFAGTIPVIKHAVEWLQEQKMNPEFVCCIYATAPFLSESNLIEGLETLEKSDCEYAFSVTSFPFPIQRAIRLSKRNRVEMFQPENFNTRSQDLEEAYHDAGQFYWGRSTAWLDSKPFFTASSSTVILPREQVQDIDTFEDWRRAELMYEVLGRIG